MGVSRTDTISISDIKRLAQIAHKQGKDGSVEEAEKRIIAESEALGMRIDRTPETPQGPLDFTGSHKFGPDIAGPSGTPTPKP